MGDKIIGRNPVMEAIKSGREIDKILIKKGKYEGSIVPIVKKAKENGIIIQEVDKQKLDAVLALIPKGLPSFSRCGEKWRSIAVITCNAMPIPQKWGGGRYLLTK